MAEDDEWSYDADEFDAESAEPGADGTPDASGEAASGGATEANESDWRFSLADLEGGEDDESGWLELSAEVEAGSPTLENVAFVLVGVGLGIGLAVYLFL